MLCLITQQMESTRKCLPPLDIALAKEGYPGLELIIDEIIESVNLVADTITTPGLSGKLVDPVLQNTMDMYEEICSALKIDKIPR